MSECRKVEKTDTKTETLIIKSFFLLVPVITGLFHQNTIDNDFFFLYPTGEYIVNNGFPHTDFLSMHSSMNIIVQQWLSSVIYYYLQSLFGKTGIMVFLSLVNFVIILLLYRWIRLIIKNEILSSVFACFIDIILVGFFVVSRPQVFTYILLLCEVLLLEKYVLTKKRNLLLLLPVISIALINLHAAMWPMLLVLMLPFIAGSVPVHFKKIKLEANGNIIELLITLLLSTGAGFLNPYGIKSMLYLTTSYGQEKLSVIEEMSAISIDSICGKIIFGICFIIGLTIFFKKDRPFSIRFFLLFFGTFLLCLMQAKGFAYFLLFGIPAFLFVIRDIDSESVKVIKLSKTHKILLFSLFIVFLAICGISLYKNHKEDTLGNNKYNSHKIHLDEAIEELDQQSGDIILFANFNDGQYLEYHGYHPYIDGRAELFLKANNKEFDYFEEYYDLLASKVYYKDFLNKYDFNYLIVDQNVDRYLYLSLIHDADYKVIYESEDIVLFRSL